MNRFVLLADWQTMGTGWVFNIQKYSIHDGPGIRTTVFLKGCPLSCWWCHNPESQSTRQEISLTDGRCVRCGLCLEACPQIDPTSVVSLPFVDRDRCTRCGACVEACMTGARELLGREVCVAEVMDEVLQDRLFYDQSGGGVTLSGGEPLMQPEFTRALLEACRREDVHTALDTCGFAPQDDILGLAPLTNLFLYDIKVMDDELHRTHAGVSNVRILDNLLALDRVHRNIWIRIPVVPGLNDDQGQMTAIAGFLAQLNNIQQVNLLPYHELGSHKTERLGRRGPAGQRTKTTAESLLEPFRSRGMPVQIGG